MFNKDKPTDLRKVKPFGFDINPAKSLDIPVGPSKPPSKDKKITPAFNATRKVSEPTQPSAVSEQDSKVGEKRKNV